jgi:hypothetical protein
MTTYTIDKENSITALGSQQADFEGEIFASQQELADLAPKWPANRLVEVWNGIPGLTPVKKFTDRKAAVGRIWKAIQSLDGGGAADGAEPATTAATATPKAARKAKKAKHAAKQAKKAKAASTGKSAAKAPAKGTKGKPAAARDGSKKAEILGMLQRKGGATLSQIMQANVPAASHRQRVGSGTDSGHREPGTVPHNHHPTCGRGDDRRFPRSRPPKCMSHVLLAGYVRAAASQIVFVCPLRGFLRQRAHMAFSLS